MARIAGITIEKDYVKFLGRLICGYLNQSKLNRIKLK